MICTYCKQSIGNNGYCSHCKIYLAVAAASPSIESLINVTSETCINYEIVSIISWSECDRLLSIGEFSSAFLVAAINVEHTLQKQILKQVSKRDLPNDKNLMSMYGNIENLSLKSCFKAAMKLSLATKFNLNEDWKKWIAKMTEPRNSIAHEYGYFERFNSLEVLSDKEIRNLIGNARSFCLSNPLT